MAVAAPIRPKTARILGDLQTMWAHDVSNEKVQCALAAAIDSGHGVTFVPDSAAQARLEGFEDCPYCLGPDPRADQIRRGPDARPCSQTDYRPPNPGFSARAGNRSRGG